MLVTVILSVLDTDNRTRQWGGKRTRNRKTGCPMHGVPGTGGGMLYYRGPVQTSPGIQPFGGFLSVWYRTFSQTGGAGPLL